MNTGKKNWGYFGGYFGGFDELFVLNGILYFFSLRKFFESSPLLNFVHLFINSLYCKRKYQKTRPPYM